VDVLVIEIVGLIKFYGCMFVLCNVDLCIEFGEVFGYLGFNGVGKIIILCLLMGLLWLMFGIVWVLGFDFWCDSV